MVVYTEDKEGLIFAKNIIPYRWRSRFQFEKSTLGCDNYIELIKRKLSPFIFPQCCVILDGDASYKVSKINWSKIGIRKNVVCLHGAKSPERELAEFLYDKVRDADPFWTSINKDYSRSVCFKNFLIEDIQSSRDKAKDWFQTQLPLWGTSRNKAILLWAKVHQEEIRGFQEQLKKLYNNFAEAYELELIE